MVDLKGICLHPTAWLPADYSEPKITVDAPGIMLDYHQPFKIYWEMPEGIEVEDPELEEPRYEKLIREVGVQEIVDSLSVAIENNSLLVSWSGNVLEQLIPEQRQVIRAHLAHILVDYLHKDTKLVKEYVIKANFHYHVQRLANLEEEPGEFA